MTTDGKTTSGMMKNGKMKRWIGMMKNGQKKMIDIVK